MDEKWIDIEGYSGYYQISNLGNIKSTKYKKEKILKPQRSSSGYYCINLSLNNDKKIYWIDDLVYYHFISKDIDRKIGSVCGSYGGYTINIEHINGNFEDNSVNNLRVNIKKSKRCQIEDSLNDYIDGLIKKGVTECNIKDLKYIIDGEEYELNNKSHYYYGLNEIGCKYIRRNYERVKNKSCFDYNWIVDLVKPKKYNFGKK